MSTSVTVQPPPPLMISTFDRRTHEMYLRSRAQAFLQNKYRELLAMPDLEDDAESPGGHRQQHGTSQGKRKRARGNAQQDEGDENGHQSDNDNGPAKRLLPRTDRVYKVEVVPAKPEPAVLVIGNPPDDVYLQDASIGKRQDGQQRQLLEMLHDKALSDKDAQALFWDLDSLSHDTVKRLAEYEWARHLPVPLTPAQKAQALAGPSATTTTSRRRGQAAAQAAAAAAKEAQEESAIDREIEQMRRTFCDKTRAMNLASRAHSAGLL